MLTCFVILHCTVFVEARVFCQDSNAKPWVPLGFTCPVVCANVRNAISRLMMMDYKRSVKEQIGARFQRGDKVEESDYIDNILANFKPEMRRNLKDTNKNDKNKAYSYVNAKQEINIKNDDATLNITTKQNLKDMEIIESIKNAKGILRRNGGYSNSTVEVNDGKCWYLERFKQKLLVGKVLRRKCNRRSNFDGKFVTVLTRVLNKYADSIFRFTDEMTEILLENIFGRNTDLRHNIFDVNKLLNYLRKSVDRHKVHSHKQVITLRPRHCLTVSMPGCFCRPGYVESSGQCVKPEDCIENENFLQYLPRLVVM